MDLLISLREYFQNKPHSTRQEEEATILLTRVDSLLAYLILNFGIELRKDIDTGTLISGSRGGSGDGGFRLPISTTGSLLSSHKDAKGVDVYDPVEEIDNCLTDEILADFGLYREDPKKTVGWCHLTTRAPRSKKRTFLI